MGAEGVGSLRARSAWNNGTEWQPVARTASLPRGTVESGPKGRSPGRESGAPWAEDPVDRPDAVCDRDASPLRHDADTIGPRRPGCKDGPGSIRRGRCPPPRGPPEGRVGAGTGA